MTSRRFRLLLAFLLSAAFSQAAFAQAKPYFNVFGETTRPTEGDSTHVVQIEWTFSSAPTSEVRFTVRTDETTSPSALPGEDYVAIPPTEVVVPAGQQRGSTALTILGDTTVEPTEMMFLKYYNFRGGGTVSPDPNGTEMDVGVLILNDDTPPMPPLIGNDDHLTFTVNGGVTIFPGENDVHDPWNVLEDTVMTVLEQPQHGTLAQMDYGIGIDYFGYSPEPDYSGRDQFRYRLCKSDGIECVEATVYLKGLWVPALNAVAGGRSAGGEIEFSDLPDLGDARYVASTLAHARGITLATGVDATPHLAWDSRDGTAWTTATLPASAPGTTVEHRVIVRSLAGRHENVDLRIGVDGNGDGKPSADEQDCLSVGIYGVLVECELTIEVGAAPVTYWISMHSREPSAWTSALDVFQLRMDAADSVLKVTGPVTVESGGPVRLMASWTDPTALGPLLAFVRIMDGGQEIGEFRLDLYGGGGRLLLPTDARPVTVDLQKNSLKWWEDREMFFDVPPGAASIELTVRGDKSVQIALHWFGYEEREISTVRESGFQEPDSAYVTVPAGQSRTIRKVSPVVGRWYALVKNTVDARARVELKVDVTATMPALRAGSYYNPEQAGHGLLLYPAANQWAGLWYTYDRRGRPTWYYLQAAKPGSDGIWRAPIIRNAWTGVSARNTKVGEMQITPQNDQRFFMSYVIDGYAGSQVMEALGSGCPTQGGVPLDISSHWFDPARAGNGYSVQTWANGYQFIAAFTYDHQGYPLFLAGERAGLGGDVADLPLEYLTGTCPTYCDYRAPTRMPAGILTRTLAGGSLSTIRLAVDYAEPAPFVGRRTYTVTDRVQLLGGPGTTQGCAP